MRPFGTDDNEQAHQQEKEPEAFPLRESLRADTFWVSRTGQRHLREGGKCEDVSLILEHGGFRFWGLADGQEGKLFCREGGKAALGAVARYLEGKGIAALAAHPHPDELQYALIRRIRSTLEALALTHGAALQDFSSTLIALAIDPVTKDYILIHLGDGFVVGTKKEPRAKILSFPENGITQNYTWLTTSPDAIGHLRVYRGSAKNYSRLLLLTDGATMLCRQGNIARRAEALLSPPGRPEDILAAVRAGNPQDDASCIIINLDPEPGIDTTIV